MNRPFDLLKRRRSSLASVTGASVLVVILLWAAVFAESAEKDLKKDSQKTLFTCPMHPWIITEEPGACPVCGMDLVVRESEDAGAAADEKRELAYWSSPTNPGEIYDKPGKSSTGEDLVPVYEDEIVGGVMVKVDPLIRQNMGIRTVKAEKASLSRTIRTYGHITYDETRVVRVSPKCSGWIEKLHVNSAGQSVKKGDPMFAIYSPELLTAQEEYLMARKNFRRMGGSQKKLMNSARRRLLYFDVPAGEIAALGAAGRARKNITMLSPFTGIVTLKNIVEGEFVKAGTVIYQLADISRVWVEAHIYEYELAHIKTGQDAEITLPYGRAGTYRGKVTFIHPYLQQKTRDLIVRMEFDNPEFMLKPDMYVDVRIKNVLPEPGILIPSEAIIRSGERNLVFVAKENGRFLPREVTLGVSLDRGNMQVLNGISPGDAVVTSGQFLLDSESRLKEAVQKMIEIKSGKKKRADDGDDDDFFEDM